MQNVRIFCDEIEFNFDQEEVVSDWLNKIAHAEGRRIEELNIIFTSDEKLLEINREFLQHDYYTDIITFPGDAENLSGEIYISIDRVKDNADKMQLNFNDELHRVISHGLLHLIGYNDKSPEEEEVMRGREDFCLTLRNF